MTKRRSARGETVDFDLLKIKEQIAAGPKPVNVQSREEFIDRRVRKRAKKQTVTPTTVDVEMTLATTDNDTQQELIEQSTVSDDSNATQSPDEPRKIKKKL